MNKEDHHRDQHIEYVPPSLGGVRLSRKFLRKLRGAAERPKVDESCGQGVEPQATILYGRANFCVSRLKNVQFLENSRAARARNPDPHRKNQDLTCVSKESNVKIEDPAKMTHPIPDLLSRDGVCARNLRETFAKVAVLWCERTKGKLPYCATKV